MKIRVLTLLLIAALMIPALAGCARTENAVQSAGQAAANQVESAGEALQDAASATTAPEPAATQSGAHLTQAQAEEIALNHAGLTLAEVQNLRSHYEIDDGVAEYDVDFRSGDYDYDYSIHAETGEVRSHDKEYEPAKAASAAEAPAPKLTAEEAQKIALDHAGFTAEQVSRLRAEYDTDRGTAHYDVEFDEGRYEYDYEIDAETGEILSFEKDD